MPSQLLAACHFRIDLPPPTALDEHLLAAILLTKIFESLQARRDGTAPRLHARAIFREQMAEFRHADCTIIRVSRSPKEMIDHVYGLVTDFLLLPHCAGLEVDVVIMDGDVIIKSLCVFGQQVCSWRNGHSLCRSDCALRHPLA